MNKKCRKTFSGKTPSSKTGEGSSIDSSDGSQLIEEKPKFLTEKRIKTCDMSIEEVYVFFNVRFNNAEGPEINEIKGATMEKCLQLCFDFAVIDGMYTQNNMTDIIKTCLENPNLKWLYDNFNVDLEGNQEHLRKLKEEKCDPDKSIMCPLALLNIKSPEEKGSSSNSKSYVTANGRVFKDFVLEMYYHLWKHENSKEGECHTWGGKHEKVKPLLYSIGAIAGVPFKTCGEIEFNWKLDLERHGKDEVHIITKPDFIFCSPDRMEKIPVEVYNNEGLLSAEEGYCSPRTLSSSSSTSDVIPQDDSCFNSIEVLYDKTLQSKLKKSIKSCMPLTPSGKTISDHWCRKMCAQHTVELITLAKYYQSQGLERKNSNIIGMFVVNQYIYLSKVNTSTKYLEMLYPVSKLVQVEVEKLDHITPYDHAFCTFSNWCLDISIYNHRMALLIFLQTYLVEAYK